MSLKDLLVKARLIEDERVGSDTGSVGDEAEVSTFEFTPAPPESLPSGAPVASGASSASAGVPENVSFEAIYQSAGVPSAPFPAERLLKILDGLRAMDTLNQRAAIAAMDAADETWSVADVLKDASRKVSALQAHVTQVNVAVAAVQEEERTRKAALVKDYETLCASISEQIAQLQEAARLAASDHATATSALEARTAAAVAAGQREQVRIQSEVERLDGIARQLGQAAS